jgi:hypothetical protein
MPGDPSCTCSCGEAGAKPLGVLSP